MGHRQPAPAFFSMAELPAPPAPVVPVVVAEEPAAGVVPADAELQPPPVVEAEVFSLNCFWVFSLFCSACFGPSVFIVLSACFVSWFSLPVRICPFQFSRFFLSQAEFGFPGNIYCFVQFCFCVVPCPFCALVSPSSPCIFVVPCAYISFAGVCSSPLC